MNLQEETLSHMEPYLSRNPVGCYFDHMVITTTLIVRRVRCDILQRISEQIVTHQRLAALLEAACDDLHFIEEDGEGQVDEERVRAVIEEYQQCRAAYDSTQAQLIQLLDAKKDLEDQLLRMTAALLDYPAHRTGHSITSTQTGTGATTEAGGCGQLVKTGAADDVKTQDDHAYSEAGAAVGADEDHESSCDSGPDAANS